MTTAKNEDAGKKTPAELEAELAAARSRNEELENEAATARAAASNAQADLRRSKAKIGDVIDAEPGRVKKFFARMGTTTAMTAGAVAGALLGVGGTVLVQKRMNRTAVGHTVAGDMTDHVSEQM